MLVCQGQAKMALLAERSESRALRITLGEVAAARESAEAATRRAEETGTDLRQRLESVQRAAAEAAAGGCGM